MRLGSPHRVSAIVNDPEPSYLSEPHESKARRPARRRREPPLDTGRSTAGKAPDRVRCAGPPFRPGHSKGARKKARGASGSRRGRQGLRVAGGCPGVGRGGGGADRFHLAVRVAFHRQGAAALPCCQSAPLGQFSTRLHPLTRWPARTGHRAARQKDPNRPNPCRRRGRRKRRCCQAALPRSDRAPERLRPAQLPHQRR